MNNRGWGLGIGKKTSLSASLFFPQPPTPNPYFPPFTPAKNYN